MEIHYRLKHYLRQESDGKINVTSGLNNIYNRLNGSGEKVFFLFIYNKTNTCF